MAIPKAFQDLFGLRAAFLNGDGQHGRRWLRGLGKAAANVRTASNHPLHKIPGFRLAGAIRTAQIRLAGRVDFFRGEVLKGLHPIGKDHLPNGVLGAVVPIPVEQGFDAEGDEGAVLKTILRL
jgi:hypothetical protein